MTRPRYNWSRVSIDRDNERFEQEQRRRYPALYAETTPSAFAAHNVTPEPTMILDYAKLSASTQNSANHAGMAIVLGLLDSDTVGRAAAQEPSEWQALALAEQARRVALEN